MGWKEGQGIGTRKRGDIHGGASLLRISQQAIEPVSGIGAATTPAVTFAAPVVNVVIPTQKLDNFGIGYILNADEFYASKMRGNSDSGRSRIAFAGGDESMIASKKRSKAGLSSGIGYGDSDDEYEMYGGDDAGDFELRTPSHRMQINQKRSRDGGGNGLSDAEDATDAMDSEAPANPALTYTSDGRRVITGFIVGSEVSRCLPLNSFFPISPPADYVPRPRPFSGQHESSATMPKSGDRNDSTKNALMTAYATHKLQTAKKSGLGGASEARAQLLDESLPKVTTVPEKDVEKTESSIERPMLVAANMQSAFAGLSQAFKNRFVSSSSTGSSSSISATKAAPVVQQGHSVDNLPNLIPGLSTATEYSKVMSSLSHANQQSDKATSSTSARKKFVPSRISTAWDPTPLLCKRFNVPVPTQNSYASAAADASRARNPGSNQGIEFGVVSDSSALFDSTGSLQSAASRPVVKSASSNREENMYQSNVGKYLPDLRAPQQMSPVAQVASSPVVAPYQTTAEPTKPPMSVFKSIFEDSEDESDEESSDDEIQEDDKKSAVATQPEPEKNEPVAIPDSTQISSYLQTMAAYASKPSADSDKFGSYFPMPTRHDISSVSDDPTPGRVLFKRPVKNACATQIVDDSKSSRPNRAVSSIPTNDEDDSGGVSTLFNAKKKSRFGSQVIGRFSEQGDPSMGPMSIRDDDVPEDSGKNVRFPSQSEIHSSQKPNGPEGPEKAAAAVSNDDMNLLVIEEGNRALELKRRLAERERESNKTRRRYVDDEFEEPAPQQVPHYMPHQTLMQLSSTLGKVQSSLAEGDEDVEKKRGSKRKKEKRSKKEKKVKKVKKEKSSKSKSKRSKKEKKEKKSRKESSHDLHNSFSNPQDSSSESDGSDENDDSGFDSSTDSE
jgi:hypothetical protein